MHRAATWVGLLECPCTDRITRSLGDLGTASALLTGVCEDTITLAADCDAAATKLSAEIVVPGRNASACTYTEHDGTFLAGSAPNAPTAGWKTKAEAQTWCCASPHCGGVTFQEGAYTARSGATPQPYKMPALASWVLGGAPSALNFSAGASTTLPAGCSLSIGKRGVDAFFNTAPSTAQCGGTVGARKVSGNVLTSVNVSVDVAMDEAANKVTPNNAFTRVFVHRDGCCPVLQRRRIFFLIAIFSVVGWCCYHPTDLQVTLTFSGPVAVWFGVGFGADAMAGLPYAIVVDGAGTVSEHKLADHAAGTVLQPTVAVVSSTVADGQRVVVLTRSIKISDYESDYYNFDLTLPDLPLITAVGSGSTFA